MTLTKTARCFPRSLALAVEPPTQVAASHTWNGPAIAATGDAPHLRFTLARRLMGDFGSIGGDWVVVWTTDGMRSR